MVSHPIPSQCLYVFWMPHELFPMKVYLEEQELSKTQVVAPGSCGARHLSLKQGDCPSCVLNVLPPLVPKQETFGNG